MSTLLLRDGFDYPDGVITNEFATNHPGQVGVHESKVWETTSGTLFARAGAAYSGIPDNGRDANGDYAVDIDSSIRNGSGVLRAITRRTDFVNVSVRFKIINYRLLDTGRNDGESWNGLHVFIRRQDENHTYYVDVNRRDNVVKFKRKLGSYEELADPRRYVVTYGMEQRVRVDALTFANGFVELRLYINETLIKQIVDSSPEAISGGGAVGIRGDNCEFAMDEFEVWSQSDIDDFDSTPTKGQFLS